jgi:hypothetical protein
MKEELFYLILTDDNFSNDVIRNFPGMYSFITSLKQNASREHVDKCKERIWSFYENNDSFKTLFLNHYSSLKNPRVDGRVFEVKDSYEYTRLILRSKSENWMYTGMNVVETSDKIKIYFY